jgi:hypothetical protein
VLENARHVGLRASSIILASISFAVTTRSRSRSKVRLDGEPSRSPLSKRCESITAARSSIERALARAPSVQLLALFKHLEQRIEKDGLRTRINAVMNELPMTRRIKIDADRRPVWMREGGSRDRQSPEVPSP